jgi:hypothetical protein
MKIRPVKAEFFHAGWLAERDIAKLIVAYRDFAKAPRTVVLSRAGRAVRSTAGLTAPTVSCMLQTQPSQLQKCCQKWHKFI